MQNFKVTIEGQMPADIGSQWDSKTRIITASNARVAASRAMEGLFWQPTGRGYKTDRRMIAGERVTIIVERLH